MSTLQPSFAPHPTASRVSRRCSIDSSSCLRRSQGQTEDAPRRIRRCSFDMVSVREYDQTLGDSPSCQEGAPISLGWKYAQQQSIPLEDFEKSRDGQRRSRCELILGAAERRRALMMNGSTLMEILHAERLVALKNGVASSMSGISFPGQGKKSSPKRKAMISRAA